jgi:hypothetical protein
LLEAEEASLLGRPKRAYLKYIGAIAVSAHSGFLFEEAIANERTGRHFLRQGETKLSLQHMKESHRLYKLWGAHPKAKRLSEEIGERYKDIL